jgi:hypothetical protein
MRYVRVARIALVSMLFLVAVAGCGSSGPPIAYVSGKVTMDGKPLPNATVVFIPENQHRDDAGVYGRARQEKRGQFRHHIQVRPVHESACHAVNYGHFHLEFRSS